MAGYDSVFDMARDAQRRVRRVVYFFYVAAMASLVAGVLIDAQPPAPRLDCHKSTGQMYSHYPHPYGLPPPVTWTSCVWR
jgi:hypothetical protein